MFIKKLSLVALSVLSFSAMADVALVKADLIGTWQIDKESVNSDGSGGRSSNATWQFKEDGTIEGTSEDSDSHARINQTRAVLNYSVEGGKLIKQAAPGRSKMENCVAVEKEGNKMVLKCSSNYFFMSKK